MLALEGILAVGLLFLVGLDPMGLVVLAVLILCIHVPARRLVARDPLLMTVARDALDFRPFYSPQSLVHEAPPAPAPSITTTEG
jgi:type IV secretory pathway TrbD component